MSAPTTRGWSGWAESRDGTRGGNAGEARVGLAGHERAHRLPRPRRDHADAAGRGRGHDATPLRGRQRQLAACLGPWCPPGRWPWSRSACRTQFRSVSPEQPILAAIERIAPYCEPCSPWWSNTIRTARSRTSGEQGVLRFVIAPSSQELEPPGNPARFSQSHAIGAGAWPVGRTRRYRQRVWARGASRVGTPVQTNDSVRPRRKLRQGRPPDDRAKHHKPRQDHAVFWHAVRPARTRVRSP